MASVWSHTRPSFRHNSILSRRKDKAGREQSWSVNRRLPARLCKQRIDTELDDTRSLIAAFAIEGTAARRTLWRFPLDRFAFHFRYLSIDWTRPFFPEFKILKKYGRLYFGSRLCFRETKVEWKCKWIISLSIHTTKYCRRKLGALLIYNSTINCGRPHRFRLVDFGIIGPELFQDRVKLEIDSVKSITTLITTLVLCTDHPRYICRVLNNYTCIFHWTFQLLFSN